MFQNTSCVSKEPQKGTGTVAMKRILSWLPEGMRQGVSWLWYLHDLACGRPELELAVAAGPKTRSNPL